MNQLDALLKHFKTTKSGISQLEAFNTLGICRLSERIRELEARGHKIVRIREEAISRQGKLVRYMRYKLVK